jgi:hypothetical protein
VSSFDLSRGTRRRAVKGGTNICPWCDQERVPGSSFCREHKRDYQRKWSRDRALELRALRAIHNLAAIGNHKMQENENNTPTTP